MAHGVWVWSIEAAIRHETSNSGAKDGTYGDASEARVGWDTQCTSVRGSVVIKTSTMVPMGQAKV